MRSISLSKRTPAGRYTTGNVATTIVRCLTIYQFTVRWMLACVFLALVKYPELMRRGLPRGASVEGKSRDTISPPGLTPHTNVPHEGNAIHIHDPIVI